MHPSLTPYLSHPRIDENGYWEEPNAKRLVIFSGAGLSAESGLQTFRDSDGLWENHRIDEVCSGSTWRAHRPLVERFYEQQRQQNRGASPHAGHQWCATMEAKGAILITQNVDTLLERAGARHVLHLHGRIDQRQCFSCDGRWAQALSASQCPFCQSEDPRVDVVFFQEPVPAYPWASKALGGLREKDTLVVVGTQATVANPLKWLAHRCRVIAVDPEPSPHLTHWPGIEVIQGSASELRSLLGPRLST